MQLKCRFAAFIKGYFYTFRHLWHFHYIAPQISGYHNVGTNGFTGVSD
uniref:Uncharacterized protein n=1 Tax=Anguilla anguilla TaxID=7936 RepID=A0A0E9QPW5_ANGAN